MKGRLTFIFENETQTRVEQNSRKRFTYKRRSSYDIAYEKQLSELYARYATITNNSIWSTGAVITPVTLSGSDDILF